MMSDPIFSKCGMRCDLCYLYRPNVEKEDRRAQICQVFEKTVPGYHPDPETIICDGCNCTVEGAILLDPSCRARQCVIAKGFLHCGFCSQYPCAIFPAEPSREELIRMIDVEKRWTWEEEAMMEAYNCKKNMDAFRRNQS